MPYDYIREKPRIFTEDNQILFLTIRDKAKKLIKLSGAVMMACVDRLVELGELQEITSANDVAGQYRVFVSGGKWTE